MTEHHRPAGWKNRNLFTRSPGGPSSESGPLGPKRDAGRAPLRLELRGEKPCPPQLRGPLASGSGLCIRPMRPPLCAAASLRLSSDGVWGPPAPPSYRAGLPQGTQQGRVPPGLPPGPPSNARLAGIGFPCRTSARPLLCSETGSTPGEYGWGGVSVLKALLAQQGVDAQDQSRAVQEGGPPGECRQTSLAEMGPVPGPVRSAQWPGGACPRLGQG